MTLKVLHVTTSLNGGAGIAARRIHDSLVAAGFDSSMLCLGPAKSEDTRVHVLPAKLPRFWQRLAARSGFPATEYDRVKAKRDKLDLHGVSFSWPFSDYDITLHPAFQAADIIHLHWVSGLIDWPTFFSQTAKPIVWTLHDMHPMLGGYHYESGRRASSTTIREEDDRLSSLKAGILAKVGKLHVVTPSAWLGNVVSQSAALGRFPHSVIRNPIDGSVWRPYDKAAARDVFGFKNGERVLLTVAERTMDPRKGASLFQDALERPEIREHFTWAAAGDPQGLRETRARALGVISDDRLMAMAYSAADFFVIPSREDNLPNVVAESLAVGTPVIGLPVGGIPEMIQSGVNGALAASADSNGLAHALLQAEHQTFDSESIRASALATYDPATIAKQYISVYSAVAS